MESKAYYLKYRPQKISELDSLEIRQGLEKVLKSGRPPHAFLLSGPKGIGKTSAARIIAKAVNCQKRVKERESKRVKGDFEPCNKCQICQAITDGSALDLIEIDAASNRGIDDIRNLRDKIKLTPVKCKYKVYIIDEVHMLTTEAFNALLKTLEEPPEHAIFILCTTQPEKLPKTIISRCLRFNFHKANPEEVIRALERAVKGEKLKIEKGVLETIGKSVDGSFRDGHKILEQLSFAGRKITLKESKKLLGQIEELAPDKLLLLLASKDVKAALTEIDRIVQVGGDLSVYIQEILERLRLGMLAKVGLEDIEPPEETKEFSVSQIKSLIQLFSRAALEIKTSPIPQLPLELVVVEWGEESAGVAKQTNALRSNEETGSIRSLANHRHQMDHPPVNPSSLAGGGLQDSLRSRTHTHLQEVLEKWSDLLAQVRPLNHSVEALLRACRPLSLDGEILTLEVFYKFHKERLETEKCRAVVEEVAQQILGIPIKLKCILGQKKPVVTQPPKDSDIIEVASEIFNGKMID
ncbi:DNA polymerase III, subunit gamma and tau [Candidatus Shapirobacteria bacterium CG_4_9_14_0_2_um_filter_39_11]|uniref:DNA polymerase III subunit gamma/tau n=1 Tax=Candidatus Shapirobacteria bacterium CG_4_9_14_0_2_um_filter_39_11 TaxID=1974478 RepID=A0A2M8ETB0_9BACT|nr:MAG: DNA polymerase III, subunit gamma and tau [Candidatus Shapirobacteria bacterium CG_4_9_14_0_2_um_filter_39_11]